MAPASTPTDRLWSISDVSEFLGVPVATIYRWRHRGTGPQSIRIGRHLRFRPADVTHWVDQQAAA